MALKVGEYELDGKILYHKGGIAIGTNPRTVDEHYLVIGEYRQYMGRGVLEDLSNPGRGHFMSATEAMSSGMIAHALEEIGLNITDLQTAFVLARREEISLAWQTARQPPKP